MPESGSIQCAFQPLGRRETITVGQSALDAAQLAGIKLLAACGGTGICRDCRVILIQGESNKPTSEEKLSFSPQELNEGHRLACQLFPTTDCVIEIPVDSMSTTQRLQMEGYLDLPDGDPVTISFPIDIDRIDSSLFQVDQHTIGIAGKKSDYFLEHSLLAAFEDAKRTGISRFNLAVQGDRIISFAPGDSPLLGLAVDLGTTKIAAFLVNLETQRTITSLGRMNPQVAYGEDVIARISYANRSPAHYRKLQEVVSSEINQMVEDLVIQAGMSRYQIVDCVFAGNTVMHHLFAGLPVNQLGEAPYLPAVREAILLDSAISGLELAPDARIFLPPNLSGYVGADHNAMLVGIGFDKIEGICLAVDIGTNTEISLKVGEKLWSCSCASGPAFEGARISSGMRAMSGAIEKVTLHGKEILVATIDQQPAVGLCGSGILDAIAVMLDDEAIDQRGVINRHHSRYVSKDGGGAYLLLSADKTENGKPILVTRKDVNEIQLAKGAIRAGIEVLLKEADIKSDAIDHFLIAGAFGTYLDVKSAIRIGMFPHIPLERFRQTGNAVGTGTQMMLLSAKARRTSQELFNKAQNLELTTYPGFDEIYIKSLSFNAHALD